MKPRKPHPLGLLHRYGGVTASALVIAICITGILLNHSDDLRLGERRLDNAWLMNIYGIKTPDVSTFRLGNRYISSDGTNLYLDGQAIARNGYPVDAVSEHPDGIRIDSNGEIWLFDPQGQLLEVLDTAVAGNAAHPSVPAELPDALRQLLLREFRGNGITVERVILDIHSGRIGGKIGVWLADAAATLFILLALSGLWLWSKTRR